MSACRPCPGGSYPTKLGSSPLGPDPTNGNDQCTACSTVSAISYRPFTDTT